MTKPERDELAKLRASIISTPPPHPYAKLGMSVLTCRPEYSDDELTDPDQGEEVTTVHDERQRRLYDVAARVRDRLAAVRPALERLRALRKHRHHPRDVLELAIADVERALVHARRSVRALSAELSALEGESRDELELVSQVET